MIRSMLPQWLDRLAAAHPFDSPEWGSWQGHAAGIRAVWEIGRHGALDHTDRACAAAVRGLALKARELNATEARARDISDDLRRYYQDDARALEVLAREILAALRAAAGR